MLKIKVIHYPTGESQEKNLTPETLIEGGGLIGRHPKCDLVLNSPEVSRVHGRLLYKAGQYYFTDLGSTDGSLVNSEEAKTNQDFLLKVDDVIRIGEFILLIERVEIESDRSDEHKAPQLPSKSNVVAPQTYQRQVRPDLKTSSDEMRLSIVKAEELKNQGILKQGTSEIVFQGQSLVEGLTLAKRFHEKAIALCQAELDAGKFCILVEHPEHFTIWQQAVASDQDNTAPSKLSGLT